jgi:hypothetical protein
MARMTSAAFAVLLTSATLGTSAAPAAAQQHGEVRHSGTIVEITGRSIVLEEMLAWQGPDNPGIVHRSITVTPRTSIQLVARTGEWGVARTSLPGWDSKPMDLDELRRGDFVTITTGADARDRAVALQVIRPGD